MTGYVTGRVRSAAIVTPHAGWYGGVEFVNRMLVTMLGRNGFRTRVVSQEQLVGPLLRVRKRVFGLNRVLGRHFNRHHAATTDFVICSGEFGLGVEHPAAVNLFHGSYLGYAEAVRAHVSSRAYDRLMRLSDQQRRGAVGKYVVAVSDWLAGVLARQGIRVDAVIENAIDTELFKPVGGIERGDRCLFVGAPDHFGKGFDVLERLADLGVEIDCVTGNRPRDPRLGWLSNVDNAELPGYYARYRAVLLPSRFEGFGLVALEAMACGTPAVMTSVGAGPDIAREIPEFVVGGPWDRVADGMAERLRAIAEAPGCFSRRARAYVVRRHGIGEWTRRWGDAIATVCGDARRRIGT